MADKFWIDNWRDLATTTCEELAAALKYDCEQRGVPIPECLDSLIKYCVAQDGVVAREEFKHFASTFGPFDVFVHRAAESLVESSTFGDAVVHKWYHGSLDRTVAADLVKKGGEGAFLIRASSRPGKLAVQFVTGGVIKNCLLYNLGARGFCLLQRPGADDAVHETVADFVQFGVTHGRFREPVTSRLHELSATDAAANAKARQKPSAGGGGAYAAFDMDSGDYGPLPVSGADAGGGGNYAAFDLDGMGDGRGGSTMVAAAAPVSNYAAFDLDADGGDPVAGTDGGAAGGGSYGMFDPDAADLGGFGDAAADGPGDGLGAANDSSYGAFDPTADDMLDGGGLGGETDALGGGGGGGGGAYGAFDPDADDLGGDQYTAFPTDGGEPSAYAAFEG